MPSRKILGLGLIILGVTFSANGFYIGSKAFVAQILLDRAWAHTLKTGHPTSPWAWMDTLAIAKINIPTFKKSAIVLNTTSGQALAFGPAHMAQTPLPGEPGISIIAAHKNTHFSFLKDLRTGDKIIVQRADGQSHIFKMTGAEIVHKDKSNIPYHQNHIDSAQIALVTCYPFDAVSFGGPMRYIVYAELENADLMG